jgi:cell division protein ZapE
MNVMLAKPGLAWIPAHARPSEAYTLGVEKGYIQYDPAQEQATRLLDKLSDRLATRESEMKAASRSLWSFVRKPEPTPINGLYLVGDVGRGKSMLMDMFFALVPVEKKQRIHFHAFMQEAHKDLNQLSGQTKKPDDVVQALAQEIAKKYTLICFDEFQMHDMSDAVVILRLLNALIGLGVVFVATSNTEPENLLMGNPGRVVMLPFIRAFARHMRIFVLASAKDYRKGRTEEDSAWIVPDDAAARAKLDAIFEQYATAPAGPAEIVLGSGSRRLNVPMAAGRAARFAFPDLCAQMYGPGDYIALAEAYPVILIDDIPQMTADSYDQARRFITLIDVFYERHTLLFASSACWPEVLYKEGENSRIFERTASRLEEMRSQNWIDGA